MLTLDSCIALESTNTRLIQGHDPVRCGQEAFAAQALQCVARTCGLTVSHRLYALHTCLFVSSTAVLSGTLCSYSCRLNMKHSDRDTLPRILMPRANSTESASAGLQQETTEMEHRLHRLKKQIEEERAKRQQRLAEAPQAGQLWGTSATRRIGNQQHNIAGQGNITRDSSKLLQRRRSLLPELPRSPRSPQSSVAPSLPSQDAHKTNAPSSKQAAIALAASDRSSALQQSPSSLMSPSPSKQPGAAPRASSEADGASRSSVQALAACQHEPMRCTPDPAPQQQQQEQHAPRGQGSTSSLQGGSSLMDGTFSEEESRRSFVEAVAEWRRGDSGAPAASAAKHDGSTGTPNASVSTTGAASTSAAGTQPRKASKQAAVEPPISLFARIAMHRGAAEAASAAAQKTSCTATAAAAPKIPGPSIALLQPESGERGTDCCVARPSLAQEQENDSTGECAVEDATSAGHYPGQVFADQQAWERALMGDSGSEEAEGAECPIGHSDLDDEDGLGDTVIVKVEDVNPMQALTSKSRLPDAVLLPGQTM
jgi:hypothetical protein